MKNVDFGVESRFFTLKLQFFICFDFFLYCVLFYILLSSLYKEKEWEICDKKEKAQLNLHEVNP